MAFLITKSKLHEDLYVCIKMKEKYLLIVEIT